MQEARNSCYGWKKLITILRQSILNKHECCKIRATILRYYLNTFCGTNVYLFLLNEGSYIFFDQNQLLQISTISCCLFAKCSPIIFLNTNLLRFFLSICFCITLLSLNYYFGNFFEMLTDITFIFNF